MQFWLLDQFKGSALHSHSSLSDIPAVAEGLMTNNKKGNIRQNTKTESEAVIRITLSLLKTNKSLYTVDYVMLLKKAQICFYISKV